MVIALSLHFYGRRQLARQRAAFQERLGSLRPADYNLPSLPDEENAAIPLLEGARLLVWTELTAELVPPLGRRRDARSYSEGERERLGLVLQANGAALGRLHAAAALKRSSYGIDYGAGADEGLQLTMPLIRAARLLKLEARHGLERGEFDRFLLACASLSSLAASLEREPHLVLLHVGVSCEEALIALLQEAVGGGWDDREALQRMQDLLPEEDLGERLQVTWAATGAVGDAWVRDAFSWERFLYRFTMEELERAWLLADHLQLAEMSGLPLSEQTLDRLPEARFWVPGDATSRQRTFSTPIHVMSKVRATGALRNLASVAIQIRMERLERGAYPEDAGEHLEALGEDPFAGQELLFEVMPDGSDMLRLVGAEAYWEKKDWAYEGEDPTAWHLP
jgi:hypothetical protein